MLRNILYLNAVPVTTEQTPCDETDEDHVICLKAPEQLLKEPFAVIGLDYDWSSPAVCYFFITDCCC